ncbi:MAG: glycosyltransferase [Solirubrobacterales bacterium]
MRATAGRLSAALGGCRHNGPIEILIFHGYLLEGTGSNVYTAKVAQAMARMGHRVHLLCQDRNAPDYEWIDGFGSWEGGELEVRRLDRSPRSRGGEIVAYTPDIGRILPVYVADPYEGFDARPYPELAESELARYIDANVAAAREVAERAGGVDAALSNHLVMGPLILARAGLEFAAKIHGSALSYTVKPHPRFLPYAIEGLEAASAVLVGSRHTAESLWETLDHPSIEAKTRLGPPGVEVERFAPADRDRSELLSELAASIEPAGGRVSAGGAAESAGGDPSSGDKAPAASFGRDPAAARRALTAYAEAEGPRVIFVGKLIVSKGLDLLLAAWPIFATAHPGAHLLVGGFGAYREPLERLWSALATGDLETARDIARRGRGLEGHGDEEAPLRMLSDFLADPPDGYLDAVGGGLADSVSFAGRLTHDEVAEAVRGSGAMVVPSTFPEAFGMVAAEAAATGALPICARHSGLAEVAAALEQELPAAAAGLTSFELGPEAIATISARLERWFGLEGVEREHARRSLRRAVTERWSWEGVAGGVIAGSAGRLTELSRVPDDSELA